MPATSLPHGFLRAITRHLVALTLIGFGQATGTLISFAVA